MSRSPILFAVLLLSLPVALVACDPDLGDDDDSGGQDDDDDTVVSDDDDSTPGDDEEDNTAVITNTDETRLRLGESSLSKQELWYHGALTNRSKTRRQIQMPRIQFLERS